jgi:hypothetical protein
MKEGERPAWVILCGRCHQLRVPRPGLVLCGVCLRVAAGLR